METAKTHPTLAEELGKKDAFESPAQEAYLNIIRTADVLARQFEKLLKDHGLSSPQYNALRIVTSAGKTGIPSQTIGEHLLTHDPDITRLIDRLAKAGLVERHRDELDRRVVRICVTPAGRRKIRTLHDKVLAAHEAHLGHLHDHELAELSALLTRARHKPTEI